MRLDQREHLVRLEAAARGDDLFRRRGDVRQDVHTGSVRHRRRVDDAVVLGDVVDVDEVARRHRQQVAMAEHRALRPAGGAAGVEQPGGVFGCAGRDRHRFGGGELRIVRILDRDHGAQLGKLRAQRRDLMREIAAGEADARIRMRENEADLARVQLGVDRHSDPTTVPAGEQALDEGGAVAHHQRHPIARLQLETRAEAAGDRRDASHQRAVIGDAVGADDERRSLGAGPAGPQQEVRDVHARQSSRNPSARPSRVDGTDGRGSPLSSL